MQVGRLYRAFILLGLALYHHLYLWSSCCYIHSNCLVTSFLYLLVSWAWWDWPLMWLTNHCPSVLWHCWLGRVTHEIVCEMCVELDAKPYYTTAFILTALFFVTARGSALRRFLSEIFTISYQARNVLELDRCLSAANSNTRMLCFLSMSAEIITCWSKFPLTPCLTSTPLFQMCYSKFCHFLFIAYYTYYSVHVNLGTVLCEYEEDFSRTARTLVPLSWWGLYTLQLGQRMIHVGQMAGSFFSFLYACHGP